MHYRKRTKACERPNSVNVYGATEGERTVRLRSLAVVSFVGRAVPQRNVLCSVDRRCRSHLFTNVVLRSFNTVFSLYSLTFTFCDAVEKRYCRNSVIRIHRKEMFVWSNKLIFRLRSKIFGKKSASCWIAKHRKTKLGAAKDDAINQVSIAFTKAETTSNLAECEHLLQWRRVISLFHRGSRRANESISKH